MCRPRWGYRSSVLYSRSRRSTLDKRLSGHSTRMPHSHIADPSRSTATPECRKLGLPDSTCSFRATCIAFRFSRSTLAHTRDNRSSGRGNTRHPDRVTVLDNPAKARKRQSISLQSNHLRGSVAIDLCAVPELAKVIPSPAIDVTGRDERAAEIVAGVEVDDIGQKLGAGR